MTAILTLEFQGGSCGKSQGIDEEIAEVSL